MNSTQTVWVVYAINQATDGVLSNEIVSHEELVSANSDTEGDGGEFLALLNKRQSFRYGGGAAPLLHLIPCVFPPAVSQEVR